MVTGIERSGGFNKFYGRDNQTHYDHDAYVAANDPVFDVRITTAATGAVPPPLIFGTDTDYGIVDAVQIDNADSVAHQVSLYDQYGVIWAGSLAAASTSGPVPGLRREIRGPLTLTQLSVNGTKALAGYSVRAVGLGRLDKEPFASGYPPAPLAPAAGDAALAFYADGGFKVWNPVPAAWTELFGTTNNRKRANLGNYTYCGLSINCSRPGLFVTGVRIEYSLDGGTVWETLREKTTWTGAESVQYDETAYWTGLALVPQASKAAAVLLRALAIGDGATSTNWGNLILFVE